MLSKPRIVHPLIIVVLGVIANVFATGATARAAELWIGAATADITPTPPVVLEGLQVVRAIHSPLTANVLALESRQGDQVIDQAILVACDLCILPGIQDGFRKHLADRLRGAARRHRSRR